MKKMLIMLVLVAVIGLPMIAQAGISAPYSDGVGTNALWHMDSIRSDKYVDDDDSVVVDRNATLQLNPNPASTSGGPALVGPSVAGIAYPGGNSAFGNCIQLDGTNNAIIANGNLSLDASNLRIETWFKADAATDGQYLLDRWGQIVINVSSNKLSVLAWDGNGAAGWYHNNYSTVGANPTEWTHMAVQVVGDQMEVYLNDALAGTHTLANGLSATTDKTSTYIGTKYKASGNVRFSGYIDEMRFSEVPEPATLALLGLGGMLIRRKRRVN